jgi:hypothetical protein
MASDDWLRGAPHKAVPRAAPRRSSGTSLKASPGSAGQTPGSALSSMTPAKKGATSLLPRGHHDW